MTLCRLWPLRDSNYKGGVPLLHLCKEKMTDQHKQSAEAQGNFQQ